MSLGPVQPTGVFKTTEILVSGGIKSNGCIFKKAGMKADHAWLEYSSASDAACCFYCRIVKTVANSYIIVAKNQGCSQALAWWGA